jgi:Anti-sigma-K factor rskA
VQHCDEEELSLLALGEPGAAEAEQHLATCPLCSAQLSALRQVVTAARDAGPGSTRVAPPPALWHRIAAETGVGVSARHEEVLRHSQDDAPPNVARQPNVTRRPSTRHRPNVRGADRPGLLLAAACLVIGLIAGGLGTWLVTGDRSSQSPAAQVVAETRLAGLALAPSAIGEANVVTTPTGRRLDLDVQRLGTPQGFYEVWLIDPTVTKMVPIGVLSGSEGRFALPAGVDLSSYPLLDISIQPLNGDPKHSGRSVLRGTFKT